MSVGEYMRKAWYDISTLIEVTVDLGDEDKMQEVLNAKLGPMKYFLLKTEVPTFGTAGRKWNVDRKLSLSERVANLEEEVKLLKEGKWQREK